MSQPVANFTASVTEGCSPLNVTFTNTSDGCPGSATLNWSSGAGDISHMETPTFSYTTGGVYTVRLTVECVGYDDVEKEMQITVFDSPVANFTADNLHLCTNQEIVFEDLSTPVGSISSWLWHFGDGNINTDQNPPHSYNLGQNYDVSLDVTDENGCSSTLTQYGFISVAAPLVVDFNADNTNSCYTPLGVNFTSSVTTTSGLDFTYSWDFGDGHTSTAANPSNTYAASGLYDVTLTVTDEYGCETSVTKEEYIRITDPEALFTITEAVGDVVCYGNQVHFVNQTSYSCSWDFGDGSTSSQNPAIHAYTVSGQMAGTFTVDPGGLCETTVPMNVFVEQVDASFTSNPTDLFSCTAPFNVQFTGTSTSNNPGGTLSYTYTFANSDNVNGQNVSYQFENTGLSSVSLVVMSEAGCIDMAFTSVRISDLSAFLISDVTDGCEPLEVNFTSTSTISPPDVITGWSWDFGNGQTIPSGSENESSTFYVENGTDEYTVTLTVSGSDGCTSSTEFVISVGEPFEPEFDILTPDPDYEQLPSDHLCPQDWVALYNADYDSDIIDEFTWIINDQENESTDQYMPWQFDQETGWIDVEFMVDYNGCESTYTWGSVYISGPIVNSISKTPECNVPGHFHFSMTHEEADIWDWGAYYLDEDDERVYLDHILSTTELEYDYTFADYGSYWVGVTAYNNESGCDFKDSIQVIYAPFDPIFSLGVNNDRCVNSPVQFDGSSSQNAEEYFWDFGDGTDSGWSTDPVSPHTYDQVGMFYVTLTIHDSNGCPKSVTHEIDIVGPELTVTTNEVTVCDLWDAVFSVEVDTEDDPLAEINLDYDGDGISDETDYDPFIFQYSHTYLPGVYSAIITVETTTGCSDSYTISDIIVSSVSANFEASPIAVCVGEDIQFSSVETNPSFIYDWDFGDGIDPGHSPVEVRSFTSGGMKDVTLHIENDYGCFGDFSGSVEIQQAFAEFDLNPSIYSCYPVDPVIVQLSSSEPYQTALTYEWITAMGIINGGESPVIHYTAPGNSTIVLNVTTPLGCTDTYSHEISVEGPSGTGDISTTEACVGQEITFQIIDSDIDGCHWVVGGGDDYYTESFVHSYDFVNEEGPYPVSLTISKDGCTPPAFTYEIWVYDITAAALITDTEGVAVEGDGACTPLYGILTSTTENADSLTWFINGTEYGSHGETELYPFENSGVTDQTVTINLAVKDSHGCRDTAEINFEVYPLPQITITNDTIICNGDAVTIYASGGEGCTYLWSPDEAISDVNIQSPAINPGNDITYSVDVKSEHNCLNSASVDIVVQQEPEIFLLPELDTVIIGDTVFAILTADQENLSFIWTPQEFISCVSCPEPYFIPEESMRYTLTVEDSMHCFRYNYYMDIVVVEKYTLDVPGAFTPLGAEANRIVYVNGYGIRNLLQFRIYNRWGEEVFFTDDIRKGWDGYYNGQLQNIDNYSYYVEAEMFNGKIQSKKGQIMLIR